MTFLESHKTSEGGGLADQPSVLGIPSISDESSPRGVRLTACLCRRHFRCVLSDRTDTLLS